ncbi:hypothetical protein GGR57DRAFT_346245 [Xylariaceae sp. FL1272]|nr:hypothetical protein GGR57DRAFT_346245 [Xylariaceae sp. FL1272]
MADSPRKIELQAPEDLAYLLANVRRAAAARIDEAFPPVHDNTEDELRTRIEEQVNEYITKTFTLAAPNLTINGLDVPMSTVSQSSPQSKNTEPEEVYESFDGRKRARVEALTAEEEDLLRDIAQLKKSVPGTVATAWADASKKGIRADEEQLEKVLEKVSGEEGAKLDVKNLERQDEVELSLKDAVRGLGRLKREMPAVVARMERARKAGEYVATER